VLQRVIGVLFIASALAGCVIVPVDLADEEPLTPQKIDFLEAGPVSRSQVYDFFSSFKVDRDGEQVAIQMEPVEYLDGRWWLYTLDRDLSSWFVFIFTGYVNEATSYDRKSRHYLLIKFDSNDVVESYELAAFTGRERGCSDNGICHRHDGLLLFAPVAADQSAKSPEDPEYCNVYVYIAGAMYAQVDIDGARLVKLMYPDLYGFWQLVPGSHTLRAVDDYVGTGTELSADKATQGMPFDCFAGEAIYFGIKRYWTKLNPKIVRVDNIKGRREIEKRHLVMMD
jgi:hypothetical protein